VLFHKGPKGLIKGSQRDHDVKGIGKNRFRSIYMIHYNVGVHVLRAVQIKKIDGDYFLED